MTYERREHKTKTPGGLPPVIDANFEAVDMTRLHVGERIEHNRFGAGVILELSGKAPDIKARIRFDGYGEKLLLLRYAKVRPEKNPA